MYIHQLGEVLLISEDKFDVCQFCGKRFDREETLAVHVIEEHGSLIGSEEEEWGWNRYDAIFWYYDT